jgi:predicted ATPase/class 3 adenylate cyclase/Tfp pilus assembly protein PilF
MGDLPRGTVTLLFTDIEGSTRLLHHLGDAYEDVLSRHRRLLRQVFSNHGGVEVDTQGDAFFYAFAGATDAVHAAAEAQTALSDHPWTEVGDVRVRMGLHSGQPTVTDEGYVGPDVHLAARICAAAHGAQVLLSDAAAHLVPQDLDGISLCSLGAHRLKDIDDPVVLHQLVMEGLTSDFPPLRTPSASHPTNLPPRLPPLLGRDEELFTLQELLGSAQVSVVTLVGPGGTGKTTLAAAVGAELLSSFPDGVFFVDLSALTDASLVVPAIAQALSLRDSPGRSLKETLTEHLSSKEMLLVLDNFEQVIGAAPGVSSLARAAPGLKVLVTSREPLRVQGEKEFPVAPLALPLSSHDPEVVGESPAVALFVARARDVRPDFNPSPSELTLVADICRRLDGLPLAIELAAARVKMLSLVSLDERLARSLKVLTSGRRDAAERQRTLRGAIAWSYDLLTPDEQVLFRRLGVFAGGFTLDAAEGVCDRGDLDIDVLDGLASLGDKSLVRPVSGDEDRYALLETIREFAQEKLEESGDAQDIRRAHTEYCCALAERAEPQLIGPDQRQWLDRLEQEHDNIRVALGWALREAPEVGIHIANALCRFWDMRGHVTEGRRWLSRLLGETKLSRLGRMRATQAAALLADVQDDYPASTRYGREALSLAREVGSTPDAARALIDLGWVALRQGHLEGASSAIEEAVALSETADDPHLLVRALSNLAAVRSEQQRTNEALSLYQRSAEIAERSGDRRGVMMAVLNGGELAAFAHDFDEARDALQRVLALAEEFDDPFYEAAAVLNLGIVDVLEGRVLEATSSFYRSLEAAQRIGSTYLVVSCLDGLAAAVEDKGPSAAAQLFAASDALRGRAGLPRSSGEQGIYQHRIEALEGMLTDEDKAEVGREVNEIHDVIPFARQLVDKALGRTQ